MSADEFDQDVDADDDLDADQDERVETNDGRTLQGLHDLDGESAGRVVEWLIADQDDDKAAKPKVDDVIDVIESAPVALAFDGPNGFAYAVPDDRSRGRYLHWKRITDREKINAVADHENRDPSELKVSKTTVADETVRTWVRLAIETGRLELVTRDSLDVFADPSTFWSGDRA